MADAVPNFNSVAVVSKTQSKTQELAELPRTLMGGTRAMRRAEEKYLPKEEAETQLGYQIRVKRSTLFNAFAKTVGDMTGKVFAKEIQLAKNVPAELVAFAEDIDLTGRHLNVFARDVLFDGLQVGGGYILVDLPPSVQRSDGLPATLADEKAAGLRPFLVHITVENLIGWKSTFVNGAETLTQVRIKECVVEPDGDFGEKEVEQIKVFEPGKWTTYRKAATGDWQLYETGTSRLPKITLVPFYTERTGFMTFKPPLEKLAEVNVAHWQLDSDITNITHYANVPIMFAAGLPDDAKVIVGPANMFRSSDANAKLTFVEHSGSAIGTAITRLDNLQKQMEALGLQLLVGKPGGQSATGEIRDDSKENSPLAMMARSLEDAIEQAFGYVAEYLGLGEDKGGEVEVNKDFGVASLRGDLQQLIAARAARDISQETLWDEMQRRDYLGPAFDPAVEKDRLANEAPALDGPNLLAEPAAPPKPGAPAA